MDEPLLESYRILFAAYANGEGGLVQELKEKIISRSNKLRPDAMLCLLVLFDEMILKPYGGALYSPSAPTTSFDTPKPVLLGSREPTDFRNRVVRSFFMIVESMENNHVGPEQISSHEVLKAILATWDTLKAQDYWNWG